MYKLINNIFILSFLVMAFSCNYKSRHAMENAYNNQIDLNTAEGFVSVIGQPDSTTDDDILIPQNIKNVSHQFLRRKSYFSSYNKETLCPNWVAWRLNASQIDGKNPRDNNYYEDEDVPKPRATNFDYKGSGWSHGHMCPAADNKWDNIAMKESNLMTNICPQDKSLNSGLWNKIEQDCRKWAKIYGDLYIVCGPVFFNCEHRAIGSNKVLIPEAFFKVVLRMQPTPMAIGYIVRNSDTAKKRDLYINTVDEVERITGIDFYPALPDSIENEVESYSNIDEWK